MSRDKYVPQRRGPGGYAQQKRQLAPASGTRPQQPPLEGYVVKRTIRRTTVGGNAGSAQLHPRQQPYLDPHASRHYQRTYPGQGQQYVDDLEDDLLIDGDDDVWPPRLPTSARRYQALPGADLEAEARSRHTPIPQRSHRDYQEQDTEPYELDTEIPGGKRQRKKLHIHWFVPLAIGMIFMIAAWLGGNTVISWWQTHQDDSTYGRPRTFQTDAVVGHGDSSTNPTHFIAVNLNRHIIIIELPGGDSSKAKIYSVTTLYGDGQDLTPVTLSFKDVNGNGLLDMEIHIQDQTIVLMNDQGSFRPLKQGEKIHV